MALKRTVVPGTRGRKSRHHHMGGPTRSPVIGRLKERKLGGGSRRDYR